MTNTKASSIQPLWRLNSCFKIGVLLLLLFAGSSPSAFAVNLNAIYYASCEREIGVIVNVNEQNVSVLSLDGTIKKISRFDIIYLAYYPVGEIPIEKVTNGDALKGVTIKTLFKNKLVYLVKGWPVDFTDEKISFLSLDGRETVISRDNIWGVNETPFAKVLKFSAKPKKYNFIHPYPFRNCPAKEGEQNDARLVYPQQLLGDRLIIKNELDRLMAGYEKVHAYYKDQRFYPIPQIYSNKTSLGLWFNYGSRYGKSAKRSNDLAPAVVSELSEGPFGFQRLLITGSAPVHFSVHEEPQNQFFYRLKADYVHFSFFYDIDRVLIGEEPYKWRIDDLEDYDDRVNEIHRISGGFDYGNYAIGISLSALQYGVRHDDVYFGHRFANNFTYDVSYQNRHLHAQLFYGFGQDSKDNAKEEKEGPRNEDEPDAMREAREAIAELEALKPDYSGKFKFARFNLKMNYLPMQPFFSLIYRDFRFYVQENQHQVGEMTYVSRALTGSCYVKYKYDEDITLSGYLALENHRNRSGISYLTESNEKYYPKGGLNLSLTF